jgi:hypothetical protein
MFNNTWKQLYKNYQIISMCFLQNKINRWCQGEGMLSPKNSGNEKQFSESSYISYLLISSKNL